MFKININSMESNERDFAKQLSKFTEMKDEQLRTLKDKQNSLIKDYLSFTDTFGFIKCQIQLLEDAKNTTEAMNKLKDYQTMRHKHSNSIEKRQKLEKYKIKTEKEPEN